MGINGFIYPLILPRHRDYSISEKPTTTTTQQQQLGISKIIKKNTIQTSKKGRFLHGEAILWGTTSGATTYCGHRALLPV